MTTDPEDQIITGPTDPDADDAVSLALCCLYTSVLPAALALIWGVW